MEQNKREAEAAVVVAERNTGPGALVAVQVPTGFDARLNVRIVPARVKLPEFLIGCQPRQGAPRRDADPVPLPPDLRGKLFDLNKQIIEWLARDKSNAERFIHKPIEALKEAGVKLERTEEKMLARLHATAREEMVLPPGVRLSALAVSASTSGRGGGGRSASSQKNQRDAKRQDDCGCRSVD